MPSRIFTILGRLRQDLSACLPPLGDRSRLPSGKPLKGIVA
ncbi:MAG: hypothetical protein ABI353_16675 [Isosphaeraceae bacterium]